MPAMTDAKSGLKKLMSGGGGGGGVNLSQTKLGSIFQTET